jgi:hypothetical protein
MVNIYTSALYDSQLMYSVAKNYSDYNTSEGLKCEI